MCERQRQATQTLADDDPSLWSTTGLADLEVVQLLLAADDEARCAARAERAAELYAAAFARGASPREVASIQENLDFLVELTDDWPPRVRAGLEAIRRVM